MKLAIAAAAAALLFAGASVAQTPAAPAAPAPVQSRCPDIPADLPMPDGATADLATVTTYEAHMTNLQSVLQCRRAEINALTAVYEPRLASFNAAVGAWQTEVAEYNAAHPARRR